MMYDWIVIGAGIAGATLGYELIKAGFSVLLIDKNNYVESGTNSINKINYTATELSYGGLAFWSGTNKLTNQLCQESRIYYQNISSLFKEQFHLEIEYRELDLLLTIPSQTNPELIAKNYTHFLTPPQLLNIPQACELEPLLNPHSISGALTVKHGHIHPQKTTIALIKAFIQAGGELQIDQVTKIAPHQVTTPTQNYITTNMAIAAGGFTRYILQQSHIPLKIYFTHAEILQTPPVDIQLHTLIMPANLQRFNLERQSTLTDTPWLEPGNEPFPAILDPGAVQFCDRTIRIGQISRTLTDINADINLTESEQRLRQHIGEILPTLAKLPATCQRCLVAFSRDNLPVVGNIPGQEGIYVFSGFSNPLVYIPPLAERFSHWVKGNEDEIINQLLPQRLVRSQFYL